MNDDNGSENQTSDSEKIQHFEKAEKADGLEQSENIEQAENLENIQEPGPQQPPQYQPQSAYQVLKSQNELQQQAWQRPKSEARAYRPQTYQSQAQSQPYQSQSGSQDSHQRYQAQGRSQQGYTGQQPQSYQPQQLWSGPQYQPYQGQSNQPSAPVYQQPQPQYQPYRAQPYRHQAQPSQLQPQPYQTSQPHSYQFSQPQPQGHSPAQQYGQPQPSQPQPYQATRQQYRYPAQMPQPQYAQPTPNQYACPNSPFYQPNPAWQAMSRWLYNVRKRFSNIGFTLTMVILVWNVLALVISQVAAVFIDPKKLPMWAELLMSNGPLYVIAIPLSLLIFRSMPKVRRKTSDMGIGMFLTVMAISFPLASIGTVIGNVLSGLFSNGKAQNSIDELTQSLDPVSLLLFTVIIAPIFEEWLFRRLLIDRTQQFGEKTAILFSAFAFGLFHGNLFQFFYAFGFGLLLAYVYVRTGKLRYTIAMHMTFNLFGGFLPQMCYLAMDKATMNAVDNDIMGGMRKAFAAGHGLEVTPLLAYLVFNGVMFIVGIVVAVVQRKKLVFYRAPEELPVGTRVTTVLGNAGVNVFIVLCAIEMIAALFIN